IQYSIGKPEGEYKVMCLYLVVKVKCEMRTCQETSCKFKINERLCERKPVLYCLAHYNLLETKYFIGCTKWKYDEKHHRFIFVSSNINLELLNNLYNSTYEPVNECFTVLSNSSKKKYCAYAHQSENVICHSPIVKKSCKVEFYKLIPLNLREYPFVILICKEIHTHPPPPPIWTPVNIKQRLQTLVQQANKDLTDITPTKIITDILINFNFIFLYMIIY
ncbi:23594_t:CDS:2, partial [Cetraspora pellucida]